MYNVKKGAYMSIIRDSYILVVGYTYPLNARFKAMDGWKFNFPTKTWWKLASADTLNSWKKLLESKDISVVHATSNDEATMNKFQKLHAEAKAIEEEIMDEPIESILTNNIIEVKPWYATAFARDHGVTVPFRNMKVVAVYKENAKSYLMDVEFFAGISFSCGVCGAALSNQVSQATGIGPVCAQRFGLPRMTMKNAKEVVAKIQEKCAVYSTFKKVWIPKSQIKRVVNPETKEVLLIIAD